MLMFETLGHMLLGYARTPAPTDYSDPRYIPIRGSKFEQGFHFEPHGYPNAYDVWIHPKGFHSNTGYMGLHIVSSSGDVRCVTLRVVAYNAGMVYEFMYSFSGDNIAKLKMRQGPGTNVTGERVRFRPTPCVDLVVLDLVELMLPPQFSAHKPEAAHRATWGFKDKPCILCGTLIHNNHYLCSDCHPSKAVTTV